MARYDLIAVTHYADGSSHASRLCTRRTRRGAQRAERNLTWNRALPRIEFYNGACAEEDRIVWVSTEIKER